MTYPKAIVISAALLAAAIAFAALQPAYSGLGSGPRYMLGGDVTHPSSAVSQNATWAIDTDTGEVRLCGITGKAEVSCVPVQKKW